MSNSIDATAQKIEMYFNQIEDEVFKGDTFLEWRGSFEIKKVYVKKEKSDIKCDLDIRLIDWPEGVFVKVYKHKALGVFAYIKDEPVCQDYLKAVAVPCKFWKESFYFSQQENLDQARYILLEGNGMSRTDTQDCLDKIKNHIVEVNKILANQ